MGLGVKQSVSILPTSHHLSTLVSFLFLWVGRHVSPNKPHLLSWVDSNILISLIFPIISWLLYLFCFCNQHLGSPSCCHPLTPKSFFLFFMTASIFLCSYTKWRLLAFTFTFLDNLHTWAKHYSFSFKDERFYHQTPFHFQFSFFSTINLYLDPCSLYERIISVTLLCFLVWHQSLFFPFCCQENF